MEFLLKQIPVLGPSGDYIGLNQDQINGYIKGAKNVDSRTQGWGMTVMHEILHSLVAEGGLFQHGREKHNFGETGKVVDRMNIVRQQLNDRGENYGIRKSYQGTYFENNPKTIYIPYDSSSKARLRNGDIPSSMSMYIKSEKK